MKNYKFPAVNVGDFVLYASGPETDDWCPMMVTGINHRQWQEKVKDEKTGEYVVDRDNRPILVSFDEIQSLRGVAFTHTEGCLPVGKKNVYDLHGPYIQENKGAWQAVENNYNQGVFKLTKAMERQLVLETMLHSLSEQLGKMALDQDALAKALLHNKKQQVAHA